MTHRRAARAPTKKAPAYSQAQLTAMQNNANAKTAFDFFKSKGLTDEQAAGIVGNLDHEAPGMDPEQRQIGGGPGHGIAQWGDDKHPNRDRWAHKPGDNVVDFAASQNEGGAAAASGTFAFGSSPTSLQTQLDFTWWELNNGYGINALKKQTTVNGATYSFEKTFEGAGKPEWADRYARANAALAAFGPRKITEGENSLLVGHHLQPAAHVDSPDSEGGQVKEGHPTLFVGNLRLPFARVGDPMKVKDGTIVEGDETVLLGGQPGSSAAGPGGSIA
jgi:uncharacterized Zn-binding protein involved in type VI secretion